MSDQNKSAGLSGYVVQVPGPNGTTVFVEHVFPAYVAYTTDRDRALVWLWTSDEVPSRVAALPLGIGKNATAVRARP